MLTCFIEPEAGCQAFFSYVVFVRCIVADASWHGIFYKEVKIYGHMYKNHIIWFKKYYVSELILWPPTYNGTHKLFIFRSCNKDPILRIQLSSTDC